MQKSKTKKRASGSKGGKRRRFRWLMLLAGLGLAGSVMLTAGVVGAYYYVAPSLPQAETIRDIPLQIPLRIFSRDGRLIEEVGERRRILVDYDDLPDFVVEAFVAAEDGRFFEHPGIDYQGILRAAFLLLRSGEISGGGSTITQQLARDYFLTRERVLSRKVREAFLAYKIEQEFTKEEIMALFLNKMFFGQRAYGVAAAAQVYYGKTLSQINVAEAATLAGVLPAPSRYNPVRSGANAGMRRHYVLNRMNDLGFINDQEFDEAMAYPLESQLHGTATELSAPYVAEMVRREMLDRYGEDTYSAGYSVVTTLDSELQSAANYAVRNGLLEFTRRRGYRGPLGTLEIDPEILSRPFMEWPEDVQGTLQDYGNPAELPVAVVTALNEDKSASIVLQDGRAAAIEWRGMRWANPYINNESQGPAPKSPADILAPGNIIYVMPLEGGGFALGQLPAAQSALVSLDPNDGAITNLVGGLDFSLSKFNRATQAARQPGSSFKPFIYSAALEAGNTLATIVLDAPVVISSSALEAIWRPVNYSGRFYGEQRVREALVKSMNLASVRLLLNNTSISRTVDHLRPFGFNDAALPRNGSLALGGGNASPLDIAQAYATFANGGYAVKPYVIDAIIGPDGESLYRAEPAVVCPECENEASRADYRGAPQSPLATDVDDAQDNADDSESGFATYDDPFAEGEYSMEQWAELGEDYRPDATAAPGLYRHINLAKRVISATNAFLIQDAMREVIRRGTGVRARTLGRSDLSGKTGTSNDRRDAWFAGFNADVVSIVWVGYDDDTALGPREEGSRTALPIWIEFIRIALKDVPDHQLAMPRGIVTAKISRTTGCTVGASHPPEDVMLEHFAEGTVPECGSEEDVPDIFNAADDERQLF